MNLTTFHKLYYIIYYMSSLLEIICLSDWIKHNIIPQYSIKTVRKFFNHRTLINGKLFLFKSLNLCTQLNEDMDRNFVKYEKKDLFRRKSFPWVCGNLARSRVGGKSMRGRTKDPSLHCIISAKRDMRIWVHYSSDFFKDFRIEG